MTPIDSRDLNNYKRHLRHLRFKQNLRNFLRILPIIGQYLAFTLAPDARFVSNAESSARPLSLRNHVIMISTFPFALSLMLISTPVMIPGVVNVAPFALLLGAVGLWLAKRRGIRVEKRFLALMLISFGISTAFITPLLAIGTTSHNLSVPLAASLLYGITLVIFLVISFGFYGIVVNFQKPQRELDGA